jgi:hypothetical protein
MLSFLREKACSRQYRLSTFANIFLRDLLLFNLLVFLFLNLLKELIINYLSKNVSKIEDTNKETSLKVLGDANLFC